ncbi:MAG: fasciclin domain-containing protein [Lysobacterales bacterium]
MKKQLLMPLLVVSSLTAPVVQAGHHEAGNIVEVAQEAGQFNTLIAAAKAAGLVGALTGDGPLTVFAPTDAAFAALPDGTVETLLKPENKDQLVSILTYHVAAARLPASKVVASDSIETLNGKRPVITVNGSKVKIDNANVVKVDIAASNGVIHVIDKVLIPPASEAASRQTREVFQMAIDRGVPLFNHGNAAACADIYEVAVASVLTLDQDLSASHRRTLSRALAKAERTHNDRSRAWLMRDAMDAVYDDQMPMMMSAN